MQITQGQRLPLSNVIQSDQMTLSIAITSPHVIDFVCFGLDAGGKLSDDRYMTFFNQPSSPCNSVTLQGSGDFKLNLATLPTAIEHLVFTASIDGTGSMRDISASHFAIDQLDTQRRATCYFAGSDFTAEKAIMVVDIYRKDGAWRLKADLQGFNEGLDALVRHFGGEVAEQTAAPLPSSPAPSKISLEKKIAAGAPHLVSLAKKAQISLEKVKLTELKARVALVLDATGSMNGQYSRGKVQDVINRLLPLAVAFDDDGSIDCWAFGAKPCKLSEVGMANYSDYVITEGGGWKKWAVGQRINDEPKVIRQVIDYYAKSGDKTPVFVLFISDGGISEDRAISKLISEAAALPCFWQFVVTVRRTHLPNSSFKGDGVRVFLSGRDRPYRQDFHAPTKLLSETVQSPSRSGMPATWGDCLKCRHQPRHQCQRHPKMDAALSRPARSDFTTGIRPAKSRT